MDGDIESFPWPIDPDWIKDETEGKRPSLAFRALETALHVDDMESVRQIAKAHPEALLEKNQYGCPPMMFARSKAAVEFLLPSSDPDAVDDDGGMALGYMAENEEATEAVAALMPYANARLSDKFGFTPLMAAARNGHWKAVSLLAGASDPMAVDFRGMDALMLAAGAAARHESEATVDEAHAMASLVGMSWAGRSDASGKTALDHAMSSAPATRMILERGVGIDLEAKGLPGVSLGQRLAAHWATQDPKTLAVLEARALAMAEVATLGEASTHGEAPRPKPRL